MSMRLIIGLLVCGFFSATGQAEVWTAKAERASSKGKYDSAELYYRKATDSYLAKDDVDNFWLVTVFRAKNLVDWGTYSAAIQMANVVIEDGGTRNYFEGLAHDVIGNAELKRGNYQVAIDQFFDAELILMKNEAWKLSLAGVYLSTGNAFSEKGSYSQAIDYFNRARIEFDRLNNKLNATIAQLSIAGCLVLQEKYDQAIPEFEKGKDFLISQIGEGHPFMASVYNNLGAAIFYEGKNYPMALQYFRKANDLKQSQLGDYHVDVARGFFNVGWVHEVSKSWKEAEANYVHAEMILNKIFTTGHPLTTWTYNRHGQLLVSQKKFEQAISLFDKAEAQNVHMVKSEKIYLDKVRAVETYRFKSEAYYDWYKSSKKTEHLKSALQYLLESQTVIQKLGQQTQKENDRLEMGKISRGVFETGVEVCYELYRTTKQPQYLEQFFNFSESGKALVLNQALAESQALKFAGVPDSLIAKDRETKQYTAEFTQKLLSFDASKQPASELKDIEETLFYLTGIEKLFVQRMEEDFPKYFELKYKGSTASLTALQKQIPAGTTVMTYMMTDSILFVSAIDQQSIVITPITLKPQTLERMITGLRSGILFQQHDPFVKASAQLYQWLFPKGIPITAKNIVIIPDSRLVKIPFEALLEKSPESAESYQKMAFLVNRVNVSYASSAQLFMKRMELASTKSKQGLLAMAPVFGEGTTSAINLRTQAWLTETDKSISTSGQTRGALFKGNVIMPLPATADEINSLYNLFDSNKKSAQLVLGAVANEKKLKSIKLGDYQYIHLATHGFVNEESPELSGLLLAQDTSDHDEDNVLYMGEIFNLQLNADLVTLSACETGLGKIIKGEGVVGLTRALTYAGARNILVSLWKVNDASTAELMINFYKTLLQDSQIEISAALRDAKIAMIKGGKYSDPYYWSPFVLLGR
jgi:CHAT domain-containing protein